MAIARFPLVVLDCPVPGDLARFYGALLDWPVVEDDGEWARIQSDYGQSIGFQESLNYRAPTWPAPDVPQQLHLDVTVDDLDEGEVAVIGLGATKTQTQPGTTFRVFLDPVGHPFCLCLP